jgi:hypothetical protein
MHFDWLQIEPSNLGRSMAPLIAATGVPVTPKKPSDWFRSQPSNVGKFRRNRGFLRTCDCSTALFWSEEMHSDWW